MPVTLGEDFFEAKLRLLAAKGSILDIGGGLRIARDKANRYDPGRAARFAPILAGVDYRVSDVVDTYHPDLVVDVEKMPFDDGALPAIVCLSVLEHVKDPFLAVRELHRALAPGGLCLAYVPFLFPYHAEAGYYADYWRFTRDGCLQLFSAFGHTEVRHVHERIGTLTQLAPIGRFPWLRELGNRIDALLDRPRDVFTTGYYVFAAK